MRSRILLFVSLIGVFSAVQTHAAEQYASLSRPDKPKLSCRNVELTSSGHLSGQVINSEGVGLVKVPLQAVLGDRKINTVTDEAGRFALPLQCGGTCLIHIGQNTFVCRAWKQGTAPPKSIKAIALVNETSSVVRGNRFRRGSLCPPNGQCPDCEPSRCSPETKYGLAVLSLGGLAAYMAISRDNASN